MDHFVRVLHEQAAPSRPVAVKASACSHDAHELFLREANTFMFRPICPRPPSGTIRMEPLRYLEKRHQTLHGLNALATGNGTVACFQD